jgi:hypothetical protein
MIGDSLTPEEQSFLKSRRLSNGITINNYFQDFSRVVHTKGYADKDLYGRPGMVFLHESGVSEMAEDLKKMLSEDIGKRLNKELYRKNAVQVQSLYRPNGQDWRETGEAMEQTEKEQRGRQEYRRKSTHELDREENPTGLENLISDEDLDPFWQAVEEHWYPDDKKFWDREEESAAKAQAVQPPVNVEQQPAISLYDLFGFSEEEQATEYRQEKEKETGTGERQARPTQFVFTTAKFRFLSNNSKQAGISCL